MPFKTDFVQEHEKKAKVISQEILSILNNFIFEDRDLLKLNKSKNKFYFGKFVWNNRWVFIYFALTIVLLLCLPILFIWKSPILAINSLTVLIVLLWIGLAVFLCWKSFEALYITIEEIRNKAIDKAAAYRLNYYYQIIEQLGETFHEEYLNREEIRFKLAINKIIRRSNLLKQGSLLISIFIVVITVLILGSPENTEVKYLYGTIVGLSGVTFVIKALLDMLFEWLDRQDIDVYEKCVLVLQQAQYVAREEQKDAIAAYDEAVASDDEIIPFEPAISKIKQNR